MFCVVARRFWWLGVILGVEPGVLLARTQLVSLPVREKVEIQLTHPRTTLVEEERTLPLLKGSNAVNFAWANTRIDPASVIFRVVPGAVPDSGVEVLSVSYPPNENALVWRLSAPEAGPVKIRIAYRLEGLEKRFHYRALANHDESRLTVTQFMALDNLANESYDLASLWPGFGERWQRPVGIQETKEVATARFAAVPVKKTYTCDPVQYGWLDAAQKKLHVPMHYVLFNDAAHGLGQAALPAGKARIFQEDGRGGSAFLGEDRAAFTPLDEELPLSLGLARDIVVKRTLERNDKKRLAGNLYEYDWVVKFEVENFKDTPAELSIVESVRAIRRELLGDKPREPEWQLGKDHSLGTADADKSDADRLQFRLILPAHTASPLVGRLHLILKNEW
ncbi:MAG: hypothetical protein WCP34_04255 [Pseudomonadota bacterium]